jgi:hypothetical protein
MASRKTNAVNCAAIVAGAVLSSGAAFAGTPATSANELTISPQIEAATASAGALSSSQSADLKVADKCPSCHQTHLRFMPGTKTLGGNRFNI